MFKYFVNIWKSNVELQASYRVWNCLFCKQSSTSPVIVYMCCIGIGFNLMFFLLIKLFMKTLNQFTLLAKSYFVKEM